jgi:hypothetical protein
MHFPRTNRYDIIFFRDSNKRKIYCRTCLCVESKKDMIRHSTKRNILSWDSCKRCGMYLSLSSYTSDKKNYITTSEPFSVMCIHTYIYIYIVATPTVLCKRFGHPLNIEMYACLTTSHEKVLLASKTREILDCRFQMNTCCLVMVPRGTH